MRRLLLLCVILFNIFFLEAQFLPSDDFDNDSVINSIDIDDDNDGVLDFEEQSFVCAGEEFDFSGINTNSPVVGNLFTNRQLTTANTAYPGVTFTFDITSVVGNKAASFPEIRGNNTGDLGLARNRNGEIAGTITFSEPITFSINENESMSGNTGVTDNWEFTTTSGLITYSDPGVADLNVTLYTGDTIQLELLGGDDDWDIQFTNVEEMTLKFISTGNDNTSNISFEACSLQEIDTDGDGVANRFDLDSDGDGCPDANEAAVSGVLITGEVENGDGTTNTKVNVGNAKAEGPYGSNGLANGVETNDTSSAIVTYTSTYISLALDLNTNNCVCYKIPRTTTVASSSMGISTLNRSLNKSGADWPLNENSAYLVLDSHDKGFVITRLTTTQISSLNAVEGMLVYDVDEDCLKMFDGSSWFCLKQTCIDN